MTKKPTKVSGMSRKQRAAAMIAIREQHAGRSPRAISMDSRQTARRVLDPDTDDLYPWQRRPNRYDVQGVDDRRVVAKMPEPEAAKVDKPTKKEIQKAEAIGREAFKSGLSAVPIHDPALRALLKKRATPEVSAEVDMPILKAWHKGWMDENLKAVPKIEKPKAKPEPKPAKKDEMGREIVYENVSDYGKGIGWMRVVKLPDGDYLTSKITIESGKEVDAFAGRDSSLSEAKKTADRYMDADERMYAERVRSHRDKVSNILETNVIRLRDNYERHIQRDLEYSKSYRDRAATAESPGMVSYYLEQAEAAEKRVVQTGSKQRRLEKLWEQHEKKDKLYLYGNKKLVADARVILKEDFGITDAEADKLFTPNLKLVYSNSWKFGGRCASAGDDGFPKIQISSKFYDKNKDLEDDRKYRTTMIHELIHHMRLWELDRANFSSVAQHELLSPVFDMGEEERHTVMETQLRGAPEYCNRSNESYYSYLKNLPPNAGEEDNMILTGSPTAEKVISTKKISRAIDKSGQETHISRLDMVGRKRWIDRTLTTSEGDVVRIYDPKARKPDRKADARTLDAEDREIGEEDVFEIMQDGTKKLITKARR